MADHEHGDLGASQVQAATDQAEAQGFYGAEVDQTPNHNYTFAGQAAGAPTPETDEATAAKATAPAQAEDAPQAAPVAPINPLSEPKKGNK